jgi:hypothetical protein
LFAGGSACPWTRPTGKTEEKTVKISVGKRDARMLTVVLSNDMVSGVSDEIVLFRCAADLRIFRLAACTMLATKRELLSRDSEKKTKIFHNQFSELKFQNSRSILDTLSSSRDAEACVVKLPSFID